jgi:4-hydroxy-L-threonine phosphate dehydrogenase PdxA
VSKPILAILPGDPAGIGPEITARYIIEEVIPEHVRIAVLGDKKVLQAGADIIGKTLTIPSFSSLDEAADNHAIFHLQTTEIHDHYEMGKVSTTAGAYAYAMLSNSISMIKKSEIAGAVFAPFNKQALKLGGNPEKNEFELLKFEFNRPNIHGEINILDNLWTTRVTSHIPIGEIPAYMKKGRILDCISFLHDQMVSYGITNPKICVAALNPHGGEGGMCGKEEITAIQPAVATAKQRGFNVVGAYPADTLFLRIEGEQIDGILGMYHDQIQIPSKLLGFDNGVTLIGGLPVPITTCSHGTAYDIAGKGIAKITAFTNAVNIGANIIYTQNR